MSGCPGGSLPAGRRESWGEPDPVTLFLRSASGRAPGTPEAPGTPPDFPQGLLALFVKVAPP